MLVPKGLTRTWMPLGSFCWISFAMRRTSSREVRSQVTLTIA
jgi:hypothetical protein